ncbi:MAG TPA: short-chain fatty acyl-CoA regulator family protein, partial [Rhodospirillales bacterium]|nr:short-chain fatty acyl-CoA regulator family protein [Rhodospirillales bacterium]
SYLHLIERNQRPISAQLLIRLAECYDIDLKGLTGGEEALSLAGLREVFGDPVFRDAAIGTQELSDVVAASPVVAQSVVRLYHAYRDALTNATEIAARVADRDAASNIESTQFPIEAVRDVLHAHNNHFPEIESAAETLWSDALSDARFEGELDLALRRHMADVHGIAVEITPIEAMGDNLRHFDRHARRLFLSEMLEPPGRTFALAYQVGLLDHPLLMDEIVQRSGLQDPQTRRLLRVALANYFAGAVLMPYGRFLAAAEQLRYDIEILARRFRTSFEQACHRLTTLQRPASRGIPFFMLRLDHAGNISKRFSAGGFPFSRMGGTCPKWNVHEAFRFPGKILTQVVEMPDGTTYFSIARTVEGWGGTFRRPRPQLAVGLGCPLEDARRLIYADGRDLESPASATPIGINCRLCERLDCSQRAMPPFNRRLQVNEDQRTVAPFSFVE